MFMQQHGTNVSPALSSVFCWFVHQVWSLEEIPAHRMSEWEEERLKGESPQALNMPLLLGDAGLLSGTSEGLLSCFSHGEMEAQGS